MNDRAWSSVSPVLRNPIVTWLGKIRYGRSSFSRRPSPSPIRRTCCRCSASTGTITTCLLAAAAVSVCRCRGNVHDRPTGRRADHEPDRPAPPLSGDFRWMRSFRSSPFASMGTQMMANCILLLRTRAGDTRLPYRFRRFWSSLFHLFGSRPIGMGRASALTILLVFLAYTILGRSNLQSIRSSFWPGVGTGAHCVRSGCIR